MLFNNLHEINIDSRRKIHTQFLQNLLGTLLGLLIDTDLDGGGHEASVEGKYDIVNTLSLHKNSIALHSSPILPFE